MSNALQDRGIGFTLLSCAFALAIASPATARAPERLGGVSACALIEGVPQSAHPLRKHPALRTIFTALDRAANDPKPNKRVLARIDKLLDPLYLEAERAFARPQPATANGPRREFNPRPARAFLERWVFAPNAPLRIGRDRIEPAPGLASAMLLAACRGGERDRAIALARTLSGPETRAQRAFAALLLVEDDRREEALELLPELGEDGFVAPFIAAELATDDGARQRLHALAARHVETPDQASAIASQARRFEGRP